MDLAAAFLTQFIGSKAGTTPKEHLVNVRQGKRESLKSYLSRFNKQSIEVERISHDAALMAMLSSLLPKKGFSSLFTMMDPRVIMSSLIMLKNILVQRKLR